MHPEQINSDFYRPLIPADLYRIALNYFDPLQIAIMLPILEEALNTYKILMSYTDNDYVIQFGPKLFNFATKVLNIRAAAYHQYIVGLLENPELDDDKCLIIDKFDNTKVIWRQYGI